MKIAYVCNEYPPCLHGGIGTFVHAIVHGLVAAGHEATVVGWGPEPGERDDGGVRVVTLPECRTRRLAGLQNRLRLRRWLSAEARAGRIEFVEVPDFQGLLPFSFPDCPVAVRLHLTTTAHNRDEGKGTPRLVTFCERRTLQIHDAWIPVSDYALELTVETFGLEPRIAERVYCPVASPDGSAPSMPVLPDTFVLYAGTVRRRKGVYVLAEAARQFLPRHPDVHLVYAGRAAEEDGLSAEDRIRDILGPELSGRTHLLGRVERDVVLACMAKARVFAFPSTLETFGLVTAEAMLQGCPVVVCDTGPVPEFVENERTGLLVPPDDASAVAAAVCRLLEDAALAERLGDAGRRHIAAHFTVEKCVAQSLEFYAKCIAARET